jgi:Tfp pilus assembly protein PilO
MADAKGGFNIPKQSLIYGVLCFTGILIFLLGGIVPASRSLAELDAQITDAKCKLEEQKALGLLFQTLQGQDVKQESQILPLPEKGKLPQAQIDTIPIALRRAAKISGMTLVSAVPNLSVLTGDAALLSFSAVLQGEFMQFRKFLIQIGGLPYVQHIEEIAIQGKPDMKEFRLKIWVAVG